MKIVWLCPYPWTNLGSPPVRHRRGDPHPATWLINLSDSLKMFFHDLEIHVVVETPWIGRGYTTQNNDIFYHVLRSASSIPFVLRGWPKCFPLDVLTRYFFNRRRLANIVRRLQPDIVHAHGTESAYALAAMDSGFPWILSLQGIVSHLCEVKKPRWLYRWQAAAERKVIRKGRCFIAKTPFAENFVRENNREARVYRIENAMNAAFFQVHPQYTGFGKVIFVGSFVPEKGTEELFEAMSLLPEVRLEVVGATRSGYAADLSSRFPAVDVVWRGRMNSSGIAGLMGEVDALILPSHMDTSPNVVSEAMCAGLPVVATRVGGIPHMIEDGRTGLLVEPHNAKSLADAMRRLLADATLRERLGRAALEEGYKRFSPEIAARKTYAAYQEIIRDWRANDMN